jgi:hypothetical protein
MFQFPGFAFILLFYSENKSLLLISVGPKTASPSLPRNDKADASRPNLKEREPPAVRAQKPLFGATEIEGGFPHSEIHGSKPVRGSP